ncbi:MAG TPA: FtsX-like permease family protein [Rhodanobacteraceae bacterium]|nr:FtsX-like permease family protein [Rhodanobacteraceae bacterium]
MFAQIQPILAALRRHRIATVLIVLQVALTLAIGSNALFIARQHLAHLARPTGIDEPNLAIIRVQWLGHRSIPRLAAEMAADLQTLRGLPGVADAYADYSYPAAGPMAQLLQIGLSPSQPHPTALAEAYYADSHTVDTLGLQLVAGRNFSASEITPLASYAATPSPPAIIITRQLAGALFPHRPAVGRAVYLGAQPSTIIGVVARLQVPALNTNSFAYNSVLLPYRPINPASAIYPVRARHGQLDRVLREAPMALLGADRMRAIEVDRYSALRSAAYAKDRGTATLMALICAILLAATAAGIIGLSSFWVEQRRKQIGIRRAIGATRGDILRYFQLENGLVVGAGNILGAVLAVALHTLLMRRLELVQLPLAYVGAGALALWCIGQLAVLGPALRAARVSPVVATRTA